jgi:hypothetical protein
LLKKGQTQRESAENRNPYNINAYRYVLGQLGDLIEEQAGESRIKPDISKDLNFLHFEKRYLK